MGASLASAGNGDHCGMPEYILHMHDGDIRPPIVEKFECETDARAAQVALRRLQSEQAYSFAKLYTAANDFLVLTKSSDGYISASWERAGSG